MDIRKVRAAYSVHETNPLEIVEDSLPSRLWDRIKKADLRKIIVLGLALLILVGWMAQHSTGRMICTEGSSRTEGYVSYEKHNAYGIVGENGTITEYAKDRCQAK